MRICQISPVFSLAEIDLLHQVVRVLLLLVLHQLTLQLSMRLRQDPGVEQAKASLSDKLATPTRSRDAGSFKVFHSTVLFFPGHPVNGSQA